MVEAEIKHREAGTHGSLRTYTGWVFHFILVHASVDTIIIYYSLSTAISFKLKWKKFVRFIHSYITHLEYVKRQVAIG